MFGGLESFRSITIDDSAGSHRPGRDKYLSAKAFELLPLFYGDRGRFLVGFYTYFRWLDDIADSPLIPAEERLTFVERQLTLFDGVVNEPLLPVEKFFQNLPWPALTYESKVGVLSQFKTLAGSMREDVEHAGLLPRTRPEIREWRPQGLAMCFQGSSLACGHKECLKKKLPIAVCFYTDFRGISPRKNSDNEVYWRWTSSICSRMLSDLSKRGVCTEEFFEISVSRSRLGRPDLLPFISREDSHYKVFSEP